MIMAIIALAVVAIFILVRVFVVLLMTLVGIIIAVMLYHLLRDKKGP